jgi:hypothetical protein
MPPRHIKPRGEEAGGTVTFAHFGVQAEARVEHPLVRHEVLEAAQFSQRRFDALHPLRCLRSVEEDADFCHEGRRRRRNLHEPIAVRPAL